MKLDVRRALRGRALLMLDFDGPVCDVFAGHPAARVAVELVEAVRGFAPRVADALAGEDDPMAVLRRGAQRLPTDLVERVDRLLCDAESRAVRTAVPTPGAAELIGAARGAGLSVAVVSNNGRAAVDEYLERTELAGLVRDVWARPFGAPELMKPHPHLLVGALGSSGVAASRALFIGDSASDMEAGRAAGVAVIGYANRPGKREVLRGAGAVTVVDTL